MPKPLTPGTVLRGGKATYQVTGVMMTNDYVVLYRAIATDHSGAKSQVVVYEHLMQLCCNRGADGVTVECEEVTADTVKSFRDRFMQDGYLMMSLSEEKEGLVLYHEVFEANKTAYVVTDYVTGESLRDYVQRTGPLTLDQARTICTTLHLAVRFLHGHNVVHLDVTPRNVILTRRRGKIFPILINLGAIRQFNEENEQVAALPPIACEDGFAPPEQYHPQENLMPQSDVYSLAATLVFMLSGKELPPADDMTPDDVLRTLPRQTPIIITNAILRAMRPSMDDRTPTVSAYRDELLTYYNTPAHDRTFAPLITDPQRGRRIPGKTMFVLFLIVIAFLVVLLTIVLHSDAQRHAQGGPAPKTQQQIIEQIATNMVPVQGGTFTMGVPAGQPGTFYWEQPAHRVTVRDFSISRYEVTQEQWESIKGNNPSNWRGRRLPVESVTWYDCSEFIRRLNALSGHSYRLPTEAEWEYAAAGGRKGRHTRYAGSDDLETVTWCSLNSGGHTQPVGTKPPNELGLYDMSGNVWEWCSDHFVLYDDTQEMPEQAPPGGYTFRGGSWYSTPRFCRVTYRFVWGADNGNATLGFRLAMD